MPWPDRQYLCTVSLPPDLAAVGDQLVAAVDRAIGRRRRTRRVVAKGAAGAMATLIVAALIPTQLSNSTEQPIFSPVVEIASSSTAGRYDIVCARPEGKKWPACYTSAYAREGLPH